MSAGAPMYKLCTNPAVFVISKRTTSPATSAMLFGSNVRLPVASTAMTRGFSAVPGTMLGDGPADAVAEGAGGPPPAGRVWRRVGSGVVGRVAPAAVGLHRAHAGGRIDR